MCQGGDCLRRHAGDRRGPGRVLRLAVRLAEEIALFLRGERPGSRRQDVREAAAIGLGLLGRADLLPLLLAIYRDDPTTQGLSPRGSARSRESRRA